VKVFVYEYCCAVGLGRDASDPAHAFFREGQAMRNALVADFAAVEGCSTLTFDGSAPDTEEARFREIAAEADWTVVIAPEFDRILEVRCNWVRESRSRLLGPSDEAVRLTSDKFALYEHWHNHAVPTPRTWLAKGFWGQHYPVVVKPRDGAGSTDTDYIETGPIPLRAGAIVQEYVPGRAASVAFLVGPESRVPLVPTFQRLSDDGHFQYRGGELPIPGELAERAVQIASRALDCVSGLAGYVGVDSVLGSNPDGSDDRAIEINPRLTTSYIGLRAIAEFNLASAMLAMAKGEAISTLKWRPNPISFGTDGSFEPANGM